MKASDSSRMIIGILLVCAIAVAFWMLLLSPKREEASELGEQVEQLQSALAQSQAKVAEAEAAKDQFPRNYQQLVKLGKAVPANDETSSLLVELSRVAKDSGVKFNGIQFGSTDGATEASAETPPPTTAPSGEGSLGVPAASVAPTEAAAALQPIGATVGPAGLSVLPYDLTFTGTFFDITDFMQGIDSLVATKEGEKVGVNGRLLTLDGFALNGDSEVGFPKLEATFSVTTYLVSLAQGITAGATESEPAPVSTEEPPVEEPTTEESPTTTEAR
ncbi:MAG: type 4a pilus biogenesis protein PilO [Solirubrobacterales bacterium]